MAALRDALALSLEDLAEWLESHPAASGQRGRAAQLRARAAQLRAVPQERPPRPASRLTPLPFEFGYE